MPLMDEPSREPLPRSANPYAAPRSVAVKDQVVDDSPFQPRDSFLVCGMFLGVGIAGYTIMNWPLAGGASTTIKMMIAWEVLRGALAGMGLGILVDAVLQKKLPKLAPGHWYMLIAVASLAAQFASKQWGSPAEIQIGSTTFYEWDVIHAVTYRGLVILLMTPIMLITVEPARWKILAVAIVALAVLVLLQFPVAMLDHEPFWETVRGILRLISAVGSFMLGFATLLLVIWEVSLDWPRARARTRSHWIGLLLSAVSACLAILLGVMPT